MGLTEQTITDQISADEFGRVSVRQRTDILRDGQVISYSYHRHIVLPSDDLKKEDEKVAAIAKIARKDAKPLPEG